MDRVGELTTRQIEIFLAVARARSISQAARQLYVSQPSVSGCVREVEAILGAPLFERTNRGVRITETGMLLYAELYPIYKRFRVELTEATARLSGRGEHTLRVGCFREQETRGLMENARAAFESEFPDIRVEQGFYTYHELSEKLVCGKLEVVFTHSFETIPSPEFEYIPLKSVEQFFVVPRVWRASFKKEGFAGLGDKTLVLIARHGVEIMLYICRAHGFEPERVRIVDSYLMLTYLLAKGECYTICGASFPGSAHYDAEVDFVRASARECDKFVHIACALRNTPKNETARAFVEIASRAVENFS
jgi:molybdate transport repressor ModE-like protein